MTRQTVLPAERVTKRARGLVRGRTVVEVDADDWQQAWTVLDGGGFAALPAGRTLRVSGAASEQVQCHLARVGVPAQVRTTGSMRSAARW